jgi:hypothetical protein
MSNISTIFDLIKTQLATALPSHELYLDPNFIQSEDELRLEKCYGITMGQATIFSVKNVDIAFRRQFTVSITRRNYSIRTLSSDRETVEKNLLEDQVLVIKRLLSQTKFNVSYPYIQEMNVLFDSGIEFSFPNNHNFLTVRSTFEVSYHEISS